MISIMNVFLGCTQDYFQYALYIIFALRKYSKKYLNIHLMLETTKDLEYYKSELENLQFSNLKVNLYSTELLDSLLSPQHRTSLSKMTYARLLLCDILAKQGIDKCLYLDIDTLVINPGIDELYDLDLGTKYAAAVDEVSMQWFNKQELSNCGVSRYFNAGVMVFNISEIIKDHINEQILELLKNPKPFMHTKGYCDQSILNMVFKQNVEFVDPKYNIQAIIVGYKQYEEYVKTWGYSGRAELFSKCVVQHMMGAKPWENRWNTWQQYQLPSKMWMKIRFEAIRREFLDYAKTKNTYIPNNLKIGVSFSFKTQILKEFLDSIYVKIGGGGFSDGVDFTDDSGTNISKYNPYFNDLTNIYWVYHNYDKLGNPEYIGFDHYRRAIKYNKYCLEPNIIQCKIEQLPMSIYQNYCIYHNKSDIDLFSKIFKLEFPQYSALFDEFFNQKTTYPLVIFIMHRDLFFEYGEYLSKCIKICLNNFMLDEISKRDQYQKRAFAFLLERMTAFWIYMKNKTCNIKVQDTIVDVYNLQSPYQRP